MVQNMNDLPGFKTVLLIQTNLSLGTILSMERDFIYTKWRPSFMNYNKCYVENIICKTHFELADNANLCTY